MDLNSKPSFYNSQLSELLLLFDNGNNKEELAWQLVKTFELDKNGDSYPIQIERILKRKLTESETFKVSVLDRVLRIRGGGGGRSAQGG